MTDPASSPDPAGARGPRSERLEKELRGLFDGAVPPLELRGAILAEAQRRTGASQTATTKRWPLRLVQVSAAAAAAALLLAVLRDPASVPDAAATYDVCDLDRSGRVDVLDAYLIASTLESGGPVLSAFDVDGSGTVDRLDADYVARAAVRVQR